MNDFQVSTEIPINKIRIKDDFWDKILELNRKVAIFHQWDKLEEYGTIDNFRIISNQIDKFRKGYFYVDSDSHKWAEAAATILLTGENDTLLQLLINYLDLIISSQEEDGYVFTYNQFHFQGKRWINHQI